MGCYAAYIGSYRRFGTVEEDLPAWPLKFGPVGCPETANVRCVISPLPLQKKTKKKAKISFTPQRKPEIQLYVLFSRSPPCNVVCLTCNFLSCRCY